MLTTSVVKAFAHGVECHDLAYGWKRRPLSVAERNHWVRLASFWPRRGRMRYDEVKDIARALGLDPARPREDAALREEFRRRLYDVAIQRRDFTPEQLRRGRIIALVKASVRSRPEDRPDPGPDEAGSRP